MPTIGKEIAEIIIKNDGYYYDDPRVMKVVEYTNNWGGQSFGVVYSHQDPDTYRASAYVRNPKTLWEVPKS